MDPYTNAIILSILFIGWPLAWVLIWAFVVVVKKWERS